MTQTLKINTSEETRYDFDVSIDGLDANANPEVRFVIEGESHDTAVKCTKGKLGGWSVVIPPMPLLETSGFKVEVIVDGYYFMPVSGGLQVISPPKVNLKETFTSPIADKPSVSASFSGAMDIIKETVISEKRTLLEFADLSPKTRRALAADVGTASMVMKRAADLLEIVHGREEINITSLTEIMNIIKKTVASVEVKIYQ